MSELTSWRRLFGLSLADSFRGMPVSVELEKDLSLKQQPATLAPGQLLFIPPIRVLEKNYASAIVQVPATTSFTAPAASLPKMTTAQPVSRTDQLTDQLLRASRRPTPVRKERSRQWPTPSSAPRTCSSSSRA